MISGLVLKYLNGECFVIWRGYETTLLASTEFNLTIPLWRVVDHEGEVLKSYVTKKRDKKAALKFMKKAMRRYGSTNEIVTDKLRSYSAAARELGCSAKQVTTRWANNRVENSHLPFRRRERAMLRFRRMHSLQKFASIHASFHNLFNSQRSLSKRSTFNLNRDAAITEWRSLVTS
jgi:putative transposase